LIWRLRHVFSPPTFLSWEYNMLRHDFFPDPRAERRKLGFLACGLGTMAVALAWITQARILPAALLALALAALVGVIWFRSLGRNVYLIFALFSFAVGQIISRMCLLLMYLFGIALLGSLLRLFGMNRLRRHFDSCRNMDSMFMDAPSTPLESFGRLS
jgi:hypothetical protein